jgi:molybdopterin/thiamine biosynthesis adenylyltransferase
MTRCLIVGAGGIGRALSVILSDLIKRQIGYINEHQFVFCDDDEVEEQNVWTQGFSTQDAMTCAAKVKAIQTACRTPNIIGKPERVTKPEQLKGYDAIFIACDNLETRKFIYEECFSKGIYFVDGRVNGTSYMVLDSNMPREELLESVQSAGESGPTSCLFKWEKEHGIIHTTPFIVASSMIQMWLNQIRGHGSTNVMVDASMGGQ